MRRSRLAAACSSNAWLPLLLLGLMGSLAAAAARFSSTCSSSSSSRGVGGGACLFVPPVRAPTPRTFAAPAPASRLSCSSSSTGSRGPAVHRFMVPRPHQRAAAGISLLRRAALPPTALQDVGGAALVAGAAGVWLKLWTTLATAGKVDSKDSRKIIHCGSGPLFLLCWPFFSSDPSARLFAAAVPLLQIVAVSLAGLSKSSSSSNTSSNPSTSGLPSTTPSPKPDGLVAAISRSGNPAEVLRGPLIYVFILLFATLLFWRTSPVGLVAVAQMAAGDGMADIVGRRWGRERKWPFSATKSYAGTAAFVVFGFLVSLGLLAWFHLFGLVPALTADVVLRVAAISVACALVELVPLGDDNVTVPVAAAALSTLLLR